MLKRLAKILHATRTSQNDDIDFARLVTSEIQNRSGTVPNPRLPKKTFKTVFNQYNYLHGFTTLVGILTL